RRPRLTPGAPLAKVLRVKTKNLIVGVVVFSGTLGLSMAVGCGDDDEAGAEGVRCPKAGDRPCENDPVTTQATADSCLKCEAENRAYDACLGGAKCSPDGRTVEPPLSECPTELQALVRCVQGGGGTSSGGADAATDG